MGTKHKIIVLLILVGIWGCPPAPKVSPNPLPVPDTDSCGVMCAHLNALHCEEGKPVQDSDKGTISCEEFCTVEQNSGVFLNPVCVAKVDRCSQIETYRKLDPSKECK